MAKERTKLIKDLVKYLLEYDKNEESFLELEINSEEEDYLFDNNEFLEDDGYSYSEGDKIAIDWCGEDTMKCDISMKLTFPKPTDEKKIDKLNMKIDCEDKEYLKNIKKEHKKFFDGIKDLGLSVRVSLDS